MRKHILKIATLLLIVLCLTFLVACSNNQNIGMPDDSNNEGNDGISNTINYLNANGKLVAYEVAQKENNLQFSNATNINNEYYVYYFHLGTIMKAPVYSSMALKYQFDTESTFTFSELTSETLSTNVSKSKTTVDTHSYTGGFSIGLKEEISAEAGVIFAKVNSSFSSTQNTEHKWTNNWGTTTTESKSKTESYLSQYSKGYSEKVSFSEDAGFKKGNYYRISFYESVSVFGVLIYDVKNNEYSQTNDFFLTNDSTLRVWEESENGVFEYEHNQSLDFDLNAAIEFAEEYKSNFIGKEPDAPKSAIVQPKTQVLHNSNLFTVTDGGYYGLQNKCYDTLNLSRYNKYFNKDHLFCFNLTVNISEKDDGYQEIYLYKDCLFTSSEVQSSAAHDKYGMVCGSVIEHGAGKLDKNAYNHNFTWYVSGNELRNTMYIRYDASGEKEDTWYRNEITVTLMITESTDAQKLPNHDNLYSDSNRLTVNDTGIWGLAPRSHDTLNMSKYSDYMNGKYVFVFEINTTIAEKDDGYQEIYLYNSYSTTTTNDSISFNQAQKYGLVAGRQIEHGEGVKLTTSKTYNFNFTVNGGNVKENMYIRYDAFGSGADTWYRDNINVKIHIFEIEEVASDSSITWAL